MSASTVEMEQRLTLDPSSTRSVLRRTSNAETPYPWLGPLLAIAAVASIIGVVILFLLLAVPISMLVIGIRYRQPYQCPIEPRISRFLIVGGGVSLGYIAISIILSIITMFLAYSRSLVAVVSIVLLAVITIVSQIFLFVWLIIGSVWTFSIRNRVQHDNPYFYMTYCQKTLYQFTFVYLIIVYVLIALQCCCRCFSNMFRSRQQK